MRTSVRTSSERNDLAGSGRDEICVQRLGVLGQLRFELTGQKVDADEIARLLRETVLRQECLG